MKKLKIIFGLALGLMIFAAPLFAQTTTDVLTVIERNSGLVLRWDAITVDSAEVLWSQAIDVSHYDDSSWATYGVYYGGKATTASGNPKLLLDYYVCYSDPTVNGNWVLGNDSLMTCNATTVFKSTTLRMDCSAPYIKFKLKNLDTGKAVTRFDFGIYFYQKD